MQKQKLQILLLALMLASSTGHKCIEFQHSSQNSVLDYKPILPFAFRISKCPSARDVLFVVVDVFHNGHFKEFCHFGHKDTRCNFSSKPSSCQCDDEPQQLYTVYKNVSADDKDVEWRITGRSRADQKLIAETQRFTVRHLPSVEFLQASVTSADQTTSVVWATVPEHSKLTLRCLWKPGYPPTDAKLVWNGLSLDAVQSAPLGNMTKHLEYNVEDMPCLQGGVNISCRASNARRNESLHLTVLCEESTVPDNPLSFQPTSSELETTLSTTEHRFTFDDSTATPVSMKMDKDDASQSFAHTTILYIVVGCIFFLLFVVSVVFGILFHRKVLSPRPKPALPSHLNFDDEPDFQEAFDMRQLPARFRNFPGNPASTHSSSSDTYATIDHSTTTLDSSRSIEGWSETERGSDPGNLHAMASAAAMGATPHHHTREVAFDNDSKLVFHPNIGGRICRNERSGFVCQNEANFDFSHQSGGFVSDKMEGRFDFDHSGRGSPRFDPNRKQIGFDDSGRQRVFDRGRGIAGLDPHARRIMFENELSGPGCDFSSERNVGVRIVHHCKPPPDPFDTSDSDYLHPVASKKNKSAAETLEQEGALNLVHTESKLSADQVQHGRDASLQGAVGGTCTCGNHHLRIPYPVPAFEDAVTHNEKQANEARESEGERNPVDLLADPQSEAMFHSEEDDSLQGAVGGECACGALHPHSHQADPIFAHQQQTPVVGWPKFHTTTVLAGEGSARVGDSAFPESACRPIFTCLSTSLGHSAGSLLSFTQSHTGPGSSVELMGAVPFISPRVQAVNTPRMHHLQRHSKPRFDRFPGDSLPQFHRFERESLPRLEWSVREPMSRFKRSDERGSLPRFHRVKRESVKSSISQSSTDSDGYLQPGKSIFKQQRNRRAAVATKKNKAAPLDASRDEAEKCLSLGLPQFAFDRPARSLGLSKLRVKTKPHELAFVMKRSDAAGCYLSSELKPQQTEDGDMRMDKQREDASEEETAVGYLRMNRSQVPVDVHAPFQQVPSSDQEQEAIVLSLQADNDTVNDEDAGLDHGVVGVPVETVTLSDAASKPFDGNSPYENIGDF